MDTRIISAFLLLIGLVWGLNETQLDNSTHFLQESHLDVFTEILTQKYAESSQLKLPEFTSLWASLLAVHNQTSASPSLESLCNETLVHSPICQLITRVINVFLKNFIAKIFNPLSIIIVLRTQRDI